MRQTVCLSLLAGAAVSFGGVNVAFADEKAWTSTDADEVRALVSEMVADAENRSSLLQSGGAGHDGNFFLSSADGNFRLEFSGQLQFRYYANWRDDSGDTIDDFDNGFETRRTKLRFNGHVFNPDLYYRIQGDFANNGGAAGGDFELEDAYVGMNLDGGWSVQWGQFRAPLLREELVSSRYQLTIDRSATNEFFTQNRSQGVQASYEDEMWRFDVMFSDGLNSLNTGLGQDPADYAFTGRFEFLGAGQWSDFEDFTSARGQEFGFMIGAAAHFQDGPDVPAMDPRAGTDTEIFQYTVDASVEGDGWNAFAAFIGNSVDPEVGDSVDDFGYVIQGGVYVTEDVEVFGRWDHLILDDDTPARTDDTFQTVTAGVNYYMHGHAAKATLDFNWYLDDSASVFGPGGNFSQIGHLATAEDDEIVIRAQFQLLF